jgi:hypothetical protein
LGGYEFVDLFAEITEQVGETNQLLNQAFEFSETSPFDIINNLENDTALSGTALRASNIITAVETVALAVATLLLMLDFVKKTVNFEWSQKWEHVLMFLIKVVLIKQVIQNSDVIVGYIYALFQYINDVATGGDINFLPYGEFAEYDVDVTYRGDNALEWVASWIYSTEETFHYNISKDAVRIFYPQAEFGGEDVSEDSMGDFNPGSDKNNIPLLELVVLQPFFLIMKAIAIIVFVIVIGRVFELCVYTMFAPLPIVTFASEETKDIGKSFLKNYIACVIQVAVIVVMFIVYVAMVHYFNNSIMPQMTYLDYPVYGDLENATETVQNVSKMSAIKYLHFISLICLALGVVKSGAWAKKIVGA